jgi:hypothetical protein
MMTMGKATKPRFARPLSDREFDEKPERVRRGEVEPERGEVELSDDREKIQISDDRDAEIVVALAEQVIDVAGDGWQSVEQTIREDGTVATEVSNRWSEDTAEEDESEGVRTLAVYPRPTPLVPYQEPQQPLWDDDDLDDPDIEDFVAGRFNVDLVGIPIGIVQASPADQRAYLNRMIDRATGQHGDGLDDTLREIVRLVENNAAPLDWWQIVEQGLSDRAIKRLDYVFKFDFYGHKRHAEKPGRNSNPIGQLTIDYRPAIWRAAEKIVPTSNAWFDTAFNAGLDASEKAERTFDPTRGSFWTHAQLRVEGAMKNALERQIRTMAYDAPHPAP